MPINSFLYPGAKVTTGFNVANSCRFNDGDSAFLSKTLGTGTNTTKLTVSVWIKRSTLGTEQQIFETWNDNNNRFDILFKSSTDQLEIQNTLSGSTTINLKTNRVFRDPSAWMNIVVIVDSTQSTASNRVKLYINGTQETSFATETYLNEDANLALGTSSYTNFIGKYSSSGGNFFDGYMCEVVYLDGTAASIGDLGEFDEDSPRIWKPKDVSGLTFGNNGFYLDFEDSSNLGNDANGGTDLTESNLAATDQATDTPTNNFCVINSLDNYYASSDFSEGNLKVSTDSSNYSFSRGTIGVSSGKWYFEHKIVTQVSDHLIGIVSKASTSTTDWIGATADTWGWITNGSNKSELSNNNSRTDVSSSGGYPTDGDIIGVYIDLDNNKLYFAKNGTLVSSTGQSLTAAASTTDGFYYPAAGDFTASVNVMEFNFGGGSVSAISSGNSDPNGYGNFEYSTTITGDGSSKSFYAICTKNLAEFG
jgi:hypothetical protein